MRLLKFSSFLLALSAVLYIFALLLLKFQSDSVSLLVSAGLCGVVAYFLRRRASRALQWFAFFMLIVLSVSTLGKINVTHIPSWILLMIALTEWLAILCLSVVLWRDFKQEVIVEADV